MSRNEERLQITLTSVEPDVLDQIKTQNGLTISELDAKGNKIMLFFVGSLGCQYCNGTIEDIYNLHDTLIKLKIIPVIVHYESDQVYQEYLNFDSRTSRYNSLLHCSRTKDVNEAFALKSLNIFNVAFELLTGASQEMKRLATLGIDYSKIGRFMTSSTRGLLAAVFVVKNGKIVCEYRKEKKFQRFDLAKLAIDPDGFGIETSFDVLEPPMSFRRLSGEKLSIDLNKSPRKTLTNSNSSFKSENNQSNKIPLKEVLESELYRRYFKLFCASEYSPENVLFYEAVQAFHSSKDIPKHANQIYSIFFTKGSDLEVNISHDVRKIIQDGLESPTVDIYDIVLEKVSGSCIADQYFRFIYSPYYDQMTDKRKSFGSFLLYK